MSERIAPQPRSLSEIGSTLASRREFGQFLPNGSGQEGQLAPNGFDFLDFHNLRLKTRAQELGLEYGRVFIDQKLYGFLTEARNSGAVDAVVSKMNPELATKVQEITWYFVCTDVLLNELANEYDYKTKQGPKNLFLRFVKKIYRNCPDEVREGFPINELDFGKKTSQRFRDWRSGIRGGRRAEARRLVEGGERDTGVIAEKIGITNSQATKLLMSFRASGLIGESKIGVGRRVKARISEADSDPEFRAILNAASDSMVKVSEDFISIGRLLRTNGYVVNAFELRRVVRFLMLQNVPFRTITNRSPRSGRDNTATYILVKQSDYILGEINGSTYFQRILRRRQEPAL